MSGMASQITTLTIVYSTVYQAQIKENIKAPRQWLFVPGIHRWPVNSLHKGPVKAENVSVSWSHHEHVTAEAVAEW